jgi:hypothetical protein
MSVAAHTSTTEIPQLQPQHHYMVSFKNWTETKNKIVECERIFHSIPLFPKSRNLPLSNKYSLFRMTTVHIHIKTPKLSKMMMAQQPFLKSWSHSSFPLFSLRCKHYTSYFHPDTFGTTEDQTLGLGGEDFERDFCPQLIIMKFQTNSTHPS